MSGILSFAVNSRVVRTEAWAGSPALDFIRRELGLTGTKEGCREGDCGACAVLVGERIPGAARWRALPSCLLALGDLEGRHLVTIEGLGAGAALAAGASAGAGEGPALTPVMQALLDANGSQCGFCSPGFVISLTAFLLEGGPLAPADALVAIEGNLCRCTGYGAILRAAGRLCADFAGLPADMPGRLAALEAARVVPPSLGAFARGELLPPAPPAARGTACPGLVIGGGTDFFVRNPDPEPRDDLLLLSSRPELARVGREQGSEGDILSVGAAVTVRDFFADAEIRAAVPGIERFEADVASILVRNRATLGGNVANASPVADMTAMLIALGAKVRIESPGAAALRELSLERLFLGYKKLDLAPGALIAAFAIPVRPGLLFNFEKGAKRRSLDIAAVNSAAAIRVESGTIAWARLSAGGVAPVPLLLERCSAFLAGRKPDAATAREAARIAASEVTPIGDVRGSADYRRRLLERLVIAHFARLFPQSRIAEELLP